MIFQKIRHEALICIFIAVALAITKSDQCLSQPQTETDQVGKTYFVDDDVLPGGDGSRSNPFNSIYDGLNAAAYGDTVLVLPGTYIENVIMKAGVALLGSGAKVTTIKSIGMANVDAMIIGANEAVLQGFAIIYPGNGDWKPAILFRNGSLKITDNIIISYGSDLTGGTGIFCSNSSGSIIHNIISSFCVGFVCDDRSNLAFQNNIILHRKQGFFIGIDIWDSEPFICNNTLILTQSTGHGIMISYHQFESKPIILNNILFNLSGGLNGITNFSGRPKLLHNDIWVSGNPYLDCAPGIGDIQADPMFINIDRGDFRLAEHSPCIDAGSPDSVYNDVNGTRNDMGAFGGLTPFPISLSLQLFLSVATSNVSGNPGDTIKVSIEVDNAAGIANAKFVVEFDSNLIKPIKVQRTALTQDFLLQTDFAQPNKVTIQLSHLTEIQYGQGSITDIYFIISPNAKSEQSCPLMLKSVAFYDGSGLPIELKEITHGVFIVNYMGSSEHTIYVDIQNNGMEDGSQKHPYNKISEAINSALEGDTIIVAGGTYYEKLAICKGIFLRGSGAQVTKIEAGGEIETAEYVIFLTSSKPCGISGFTIYNKTQSYCDFVLKIDALQAIVIKNRILNDEQVIGNSLVSWSNAKGGIFQGNYIRGGCLYELEASNSSDLLIANNMFVALATPIAAIYCQESNAKIIGNKCELGWTSSGILATYASDLSIHNNIIESKFSGGGIGISIKESISKIENNTLVICDIGIAVKPNSMSDVMNNIIIGSSYSVAIYSKGQTNSNYNNLWNHSKNYDGISGGIGDLSANPLFADSTRSDFHLKPGSPCIDAGNPDPIYNDLDGSRNDMGAFGGPYADTTGFLGRQIAIVFAAPQKMTGDTLCIFITATNVLGISNIEMKIKYNDSHLRLLGIRHGGITQAFSLSESQEAPGITQLRLSSPLVIRHNSGSICELIAQVQSTTDTATVIRLNDLIFKDQVDNVYAAATVEGHIKITAVKAENWEKNLVPDKFALLQNYPNPFNPTTTIRFDLPKPARISLKIYNLLGQEIYTFDEGIKSAGHHQIIWDGKDDHGIAMPSGLYFCRLSVAGERWVQTRKLVLIR